VSQVILRALAKDPAQRFQTAGEFVAALRDDSTVVLPLPKQTFRRDWLRVVPALFIGMAILAGSGLIALGLRQGETNVVVEASPAPLPTTVLPTTVPPPPLTIEVPDVCGCSVEEARDRLREAGLDMEDPQEEFSDDTPKGQVFRQDPPAGQSTAAGGVVSVTVSRGPRYLCPESASRPLTKKDLEGKSAWELTLMRNEIYARHGRSFRRADLQKYFDGKPWYRRNPAYRDSLLSSLEKKNAAFILHYQQEYGLQ